jgi:hypothetical protein
MQKVIQGRDVMVLTKTKREKRAVHLGIIIGIILGLISWII